MGWTMCETVVELNVVWIRQINCWCFLLKSLEYFAKYLENQFIFKIYSSVKVKKKKSEVTRIRMELAFRKSAHFYYSQDWSTT